MNFNAKTQRNEVAKKLDRGMVPVERVTPCAPSPAFAAGRGLPALPEIIFLRVSASLRLCVKN
jgi:hypothetical protein